MKVSGQRYPCSGLYCQVASWLVHPQPVTAASYQYVGILSGLAECIYLFWTDTPTRDMLVSLFPFPWKNQAQGKTDNLAQQMLPRFGTLHLRHFATQKTPLMASLVRYVQPGGMHSKDETEMSSGCSCSFHFAADGFLYQFEQQCLACAPLQVISANTKHWCRSLSSLIWGWVKTHGEWTSIGSAMTIWGTVWDAVTIGLDPRGTRSDLVQVCLGVPRMLHIMMLYVMDTSGIGLRWFLWKLNFIETNGVFARMIVFIDNNDT